MMSNTIMKWYILLSGDTIKSGNLWYIWYLVLWVCCNRKMLSMHVNRIAVLFTIHIVIYRCTNAAVTVRNCTCAYYREYKDIGPFCHTWRSWVTSFCFRTGWGNAQACPAAAQWKNENLYVTANTLLTRLRAHPV